MATAPNSVKRQPRQANSVWQGEPALGGWYTEAEIAAVEAAIRDSMHWQVGFQATREVEAFESAFADYIGVAHAIAVNGGGTGIDIALMCLDLQPGDEVISCALNFPGSHLAVIGQGGRLVLCEPEPRTLNLDPNDVIRCISPRTRAILATHMNGLSADMDALLEIAERHPHPKHGPLKVIGDAARACGGRDSNAMIGKKGWMTVFSFQSKKLMTTLGEGGMIVTDDAAVAARARRIRSFGCGEDWGTNYKMTKVQAAVGLVQLRRLDEMNRRRILLAQARTRLLARVDRLIVPLVPPSYRHVFYLYTLMLPSRWAGPARDQLIDILEQDYRIGCRVANAPTYHANRLIRTHTEGQRLPCAEALGARLFCPVLHPLMNHEDNAYVARALADVVARLQ